METLPESAEQVPPSVRPWLLDRAWSHEKLWGLDLPVDELPTAQLAWQLDLPLWRGSRAFEIRPRDVVDGPHRARVQAADLAYPLHVTWRNGRWVVLDGVHRLLKAVWAGHESVRVRKLPRTALALIAD